MHQNLFFAIKKRNFKVLNQLKNIHVKTMQKYRRQCLIIVNTKKSSYLKLLFLKIVFKIS